MSQRVIGTYRLIADLSQGGMARVYLALSDKQPGFQKLFVLKVLRDEMASDPEFISMFLDEARLAARLNHSNVVHTYEVGQSDEKYFIAMEYLEGQSLSSVLARVGRKNFPLDIHLKFLSETLAGLQYAHELHDYDGTPLQIVHRDVSPQNVFVTYGGQAKLLDFGIAKATGAASFTREGVVKGKVAYMAPEQAVGLPVDRRSDVFAIGVLVWEAIAKRRMVLPDEPELLVIERRLSGEDPKISSVVPDVPPELEAICSKALHPTPAERYQTAAEMQRDIDRYLASVGAPDAQSIAALLETHFAADKKKIREAIEQTVKAESTARASSSEPLIMLGTRERVKTPGTGPGTDTRTPYAVADSTQVTQVGKPPARKGRGLAYVGVGLAVLAIGAVLAPKWLRSEPPKTTTTTTTAPTAAEPSEPTPTAKPSSVRFTVVASPPTARVTIDDVAVANPYVGESVPGAHRRVSATADGFAPQSVDVIVEKDQRVDLALVPVPTATHVVTSAHGGTTKPRTNTPTTKPTEHAPPEPAPKPTAEPQRPDPSPTARPKRKVDENNPY